MSKQVYRLKVNRGKRFEFLDNIALEPDDTDEQKQIEIERIRNEYNLLNGEDINISNFYDVYK